MKRRIAILITLSLLMVATGSYAQQVYNSSGRKTEINKKKKDKVKGFDPSRLVFGGGLGLSFGDYTSVSLAPVIGYRFTDKLAAGIGLGYQYLKIRNYIELTDLNLNTDYYDYKASIFYPSIWARYVVFNNIFVQAEFEHDFQGYTDYRYAQSGSIESFKRKYDNNAALLGVGFRQRITENSSFLIMAMYDVIQDEYSPYKNRIDFRFGFNVGF